MSRNTESPSTTITGSATLTRSWYGQIRSAFGKPYVALMSAVHDPATASNPSQPVSSLLGTIPSLRFATPAGLRDLAAATSEEQVARGDVITRQGEPSFDVFFIIAGTFDVSISHAGHAPDFIRTLSAGDSFGELGVLYDVPRTATVCCTSAGQILRIPGDAFLDALDPGS